MNAPLWDQSSFYGRFRHFAWMTNPINVFNSQSDLENAKNLVEKYKIGEEPPGTTEQQVTKNGIFLIKTIPLIS